VRLAFMDRTFPPYLGRGIDRTRKWRFRGGSALRQTGLLCVKTGARLSCLSSRDGNSSRVSLTTAVDWIAIEPLRAVKKLPYSAGYVFGRKDH
jgi:hypothetical protein